MELKFSIQPYQTDAVNSIVRIFDGMRIKQSQFTIDISKGLDNVSGLALEGQAVSYLTGFANKCSLTASEVLNNVRKIQDKNNIRMSTTLGSLNFSVEMETGTGKTYVYTKTILELNKLYGMTKFIIVVPSLAIKEGVFKSFKTTERHFREHYDNVIYRYFIYDSNDLNPVQSYATSSNIEIMIINIDAFRKSFTDTSKETKANIIHRPNDKLSGNKPIDLIASTNPIVIIDEPQSVDNTENAKLAIKTLNPLIILRYSATHKELYNLLYRLSPVDAYQQNLVKRIEVSSITEDKINYLPFVKLISVEKKTGHLAQIEINRITKSGEVKRERVNARMGDDLWELSNQLDYYKDQNLIVDDIDAFEGNENIVFLNGVKLLQDESYNDSDPKLLKKAQIRETIYQHLKKEKHYLSRGIKVLSLFFLDEVKNYRVYNDEGVAVKGEYAKWFEEEYEYLINNTFSYLKKEFPNVNFNATDIHDGYFSIDKKGKTINSKNGDSLEDESAYKLIMQDKEKLLSFEEPRRFIFSHSALKEGWDNPNVFQVCTLVESKDTFTKRQKIGRGLRLCVDQSGERILDMKYNKLCVVANESYVDFAKKLQEEFVDEGFKFGIVDSISFKGLTTFVKHMEKHTISKKESSELVSKLLKIGYINTSGTVLEKFFNDLNDGSYKVVGKFENASELIVEKMETGTIYPESFEGLVFELEVDNIQVMSEADSIRLHKYLKDNGYINSKDKVEDKFYSDISNGLFEVHEDFGLFKEKIISEIRYLSKEVEVKNIREKVEIKLNKEVYLSENFKSLWNKIKHKTIYKVNIDMKKMIAACIYNIDHMPEVKAEVIRKSTGAIDINSSGISISDESFSMINDVRDFENLTYPDLVRRLQDNTGLLRKSIIDIVKNTKRVNDFFKNPEVFISRVSNIINSLKFAMQSEGLEYFKLDEEYVQTQIFDDLELFGYKDFNVLDISNRKNVYDHVIFDSIIEKQFALDAERDNDVVLYAKLPSEFKIDTPFGKYNPDWVVVIQRDDEDKLYFVAETKGATIESSLRESEKNKILSGRKHFEVIDGEIKYEVVSSLKTLKEYI